jgi:integrase
MAGQIIPKGDRRWLVKVFKGRDPNTGKKKYFSKQINGAKKDAQKFLNGVLRDMDMGNFIEPTPMTLGMFLDQWLHSAAKPRLSARTFYDYEYLLKQYVRSSLGSIKLAELQPLEIQKLYTNLQERGLSARTVRYVHAVLSSALKQAVRWRMVFHNPAAAVELPKQSRKEMQALSPEEASRFLAAASEDRFDMVFIFALATGMRPEEYLGLQWKDIDFSRGIARVQRTLIWPRQGGSWYFGEPKTAKSRRSIPLPISVVYSLSRHKRDQAEERLKAGPKYQNNDLIFATSEGTPIMMRNLLRRHFKPILKRAELPETIRLYDLRHSCATLLLAEGEHAKVVSERLGHASITLTLDTYAHVLPSMQKAASDKLENLLFSKTDTPVTHQKEKGNLLVASK